MFTDTYSDNDEVEPAPCISEVFFKPISRPLDEHLKDEDDGEDLVEHLEGDLQPRPVRQVHVLDGLLENKLFSVSIIAPWSRMTKTPRSFVVSFASEKAKCPAGRGIYIYFSE